MIYVFVQEGKDKDNLIPCVYIKQYRILLFQYKNNLNPTGSFWILCHTYCAYSKAHVAGIGENIVTMSYIFNVNIHLSYDIVNCFVIIYNKYSNKV